MKHLLNPGKNPLYIFMGGMLNKPGLQVLIYPGKFSVCLGLGGMEKMPCL